MLDLYKKIDEKKVKLDALRPLPPALVHNIEQWLRIDLTYNSNAIEGNTLSAAETALVVEKGLTIGGKTVKEHLEAINHTYALDYIQDLAKEKRAIDNTDIKNIHRLILKGIDDQHAGGWRTINVKIAGSDVVLASPLSIQDCMHDFQEWLKTNTDHPIKKAAEAHLQLVTIHPFVDGNGRTARLLMNLLLLQQGYPIAIIKNKDRMAYINALEKAQKTGDDYDFIELICKAVDHTLDVWLDAVHKI